jgi:hypothetical protein
MKDLSVLHVQLQNFELFNEYCGKILESRPQMKSNWLAFSISFYLLKNFEAAEKVLREFEAYVFLLLIRMILALIPMNMKLASTLCIVI